MALSSVSFSFKRVTFQIIGAIFFVACGIQIGLFYASSTRQSKSFSSEFSENLRSNSEHLKNCVRNVDETVLTSNQEDRSHVDTVNKTTTDTPPSASSFNDSAVDKKFFIGNPYTFNPSKPEVTSELDLVTSSLRNGHTVWWCSDAFGSLADYCFYRNICYNTSARGFIFLANEYTAQAYQKTYKSHEDMLSGQVTPTRSKASVGRILPMNSNAKANILFANRVTPQYPEHQNTFNSSVIDVPAYWMNTSTWLPGLSMNLKNLWYTSGKVAPMMHASKLRSVGVNFPPIETVFIPNTKEKFSGTWQTNMISVFANLEKPANEAEKVFFINSPKLLRKLGKDNNIVCFSKLTATGFIPTVNNDFDMSMEVRKRVYDKAGLPPPEFSNGFVGRTKRLPLKALVLDRPKKQPRSMINKDQVLELLDLYGVDYTYVVGPSAREYNFSQQVKLFSEHSILIGVHGAGLLNSMFMPSGSAVIEIFPYLLQHKLYQFVAAHAGVAHFPVYTYNRTITDYLSNKTYGLYEKARCHAKTGLEHVYVSGTCRNAWVSYSFPVPMQPFELALRQALEVVGQRRDPKFLYDPGLPVISNNRLETPEQAKRVDAALKKHKTKRK